MDVKKWSKFCKESALKTAIFCKRVMEKYETLSTAKQVFWILSFIIVILCIVLLFSSQTESPNSNTTSTVSPQSETPNNNTPPTVSSETNSETATVVAPPQNANNSERISDIQTFSAFHKKFVELDNPLEDAAVNFSKAEQKDIKRHDLYKLYSDAKDLNDVAKSVSYQITTSFSVPSFNNDKVQKNAQNIHDFFGGYALGLEYASQNYMDVANGSGSPEEVITARDNIEKASAWILQTTDQIAINITEAYEALGIDEDQIDIKNGGVLEHQSANK